MMILEWVYVFLIMCVLGYITWLSLKKKIHMHHWVTVKHTGKYMYLECSRCGVRTYIEVSEGGYQPLDYEWLKGNE